ncbi:peptidylprolyl isomerase [Paenibacillus sp. GYB004]|uniref:peptidylprolyl isomerase n=1 Tax=Paenibacillus sp. GYB004 TaxID=2994393 RepID=UPI002F96B4EA
MWGKPVKPLRMMVIVGALALTIAGCGEKPASNAGEGAAEGAKSWSSPPPMTIKSDKKYEAVIDTTEGKITVSLFNDTAPKTVNSFVFLSKEKFYDNVIFHRVIKGFMIQTGDPTGTGRGGPGYKLEDELKTTRKYEPGIVAMANSGRNTAGSQFFICSGSSCSNLNQKPDYTIIGQVTSGMDVVTKISEVPVKLGADGDMSSPIKEVKINTIEISEK